MSQRFEFEHFDDGRLIVNRPFADLLRRNELTTFESLLGYRGGRVAKDLLRERTTSRILLSDADGRQQAFYLKRHGPPPWKEFVKPWLRLTRPTIGAENEWRAILEFHRAGIATMTPVAVGRRGGRSLLLTKALDGCVKLPDWLRSHGAGPQPKVIDGIAEVARTMHAAGLHHQDFYLHHLMVADGGQDRRNRASSERPGFLTIYVIDLGRARRRRRLAQRWIVKDLAQLNYSATMFSDGDRRRFLQRYLGRPLARDDERLIRRIDRKTAAISRHTRKHRL